MEGFTELLQTATEQVDHRFFHISLDGGQRTYRERVYCYELYHQLRVAWPSDSLYCLNGELDKAAHPTLVKLGASKAKPDLLVHSPGNMDANSTVIEVKCCGAAKKGIVKDLKTLVDFRTKVGYQRAIYLVYGYELEGTLARVRKLRSEMPEPALVELWAHRAPAEPAVRIQD